MSWHALQEIEEAAKRTRDLLLPFDWKLWAKIAIMAFFVGGFTFPGFTGGDFSASSDDFGRMHDQNMYSDTGFGPMMPDLGLTNMLVLGIVFGVLGLTLLFGVLRAVFGFVYYRSLLDDDVRIRKNFSRHFGDGLRLFVFEISAVFAFFLLGALLVLPVFINPFFGILTILLAIPLVIIGLTFFQLTTDFIPLLMIESGKGVIASWHKLYDMILDEWRQIGLYVVVKMILGVMFQIAIASAALFLGLLLLLPVGLVVLTFYVIYAPLAAVAVVLGIIAWLIAVIYFLNGPATTFFRYYSILVYNDLTQEEAVEN